MTLRAETELLHAYLVFCLAVGHYLLTSELSENAGMTKAESFGKALRQVMIQELNVDPNELAKELDNA